MSFNPSAPADSDNLYDVYTGTWTNWDRGVVFGATLTLGRSEGTLLIAFVALFVTIVGARAWRVACFALHQALSSTRAHDGLYHQRQATLRNSFSPASGLISLIQLSWAWRRRISKSWNRLAIPITFAVLFVVAFTVASGFSSRVATGTQVLLSSPRCGILNPPVVFNNYTAYQLISMPYYTKQMKNAANYVQQCYSPEASGKLGCNTFVKKRLQMGTTVNASCPFSGGICRRDNQTLLLDTGYLDSHEDFGLNAPAEERFQYRSLLHCSPLVTEGYKSVRNLSSDRSYTRYHYGQFDFANYTYEYTNDAVWEAKQIRFRPDTIEYDLGARFAWYKNGSLASQSVFNPIPNLARTDSDVLLFFLSAGSIFFTSPASDDWYRGTRLVDVARRAEASNDTSENPTIDIFAQDEAASPMACVSQEQYCNPNLPEGSRCGPLSSRLDSWYNSYPALFPEQAMQDRVKWFWDATLTVDNAVAYLGSQSLTSRNSLSGGAQGPLSDHQWHLDVQNWFETRLAYMQAYFVDLATGPSDISLQQYVVKPNSTGEQSMCRNQKILSTAHISFSLFGLYFIFCLGSIIIVVSYIIEPALGWLQKRHHRGEYQRLEWCANETLQLQRLAHEGIGFGTWSHAIDIVPVTKGGELLAVLDLENPEHPRLKAPTAGTVEEVGRVSGDIESRSAVDVPHSDSIRSETLQDEGSNTEIVGKEGKDNVVAIVSEKPTRTQTF